MNAARVIDSDSPRVHEQSIALRHAISQNTDLSPKISEVLSSFTSPSATTNLKKHNADFLAKHSSSPAHVLAAIKVKKLLGEKDADKEMHGLLEVPGVEYSHAIEALETLRGWRSGEVEIFKTKAQGKWPDVTRLR